MPPEDDGRKECHSRTTRQKIASEKQFLTQITRALVCEQATAKRNKRYVSGDRSDLSLRQANLGARTQSLIRESRPIIWPYNSLDPRVYSSLRSGTRMTKGRGHEDDRRKERSGMTKRGRRTLCGRNDKGGWTLGSSPRVTEKRGYEGDIKKRGEGDGNSHQKPEISN